MAGFLITALNINPYWVDIQLGYILDTRIEQQLFFFFLKKGYYLCPSLKFGPKANLQGADVCTTMKLSTSKYLGHSFILWLVAKLVEEMRKPHFSFTAHSVSWLKKLAPKC